MAFRKIIGIKWLWFLKLIKSTNAHKIRCTIKFYRNQIKHIKINYSHHLCYLLCPQHDLASISHSIMRKSVSPFFLFLQKTLIKNFKNQLYLRKCSPVTYRFHSDDLWSIIIAIRKVLSSLQYLTGPTHASTLRGKWNNIGVRLANKFFAFLTALGYWLLHSC